MKLEILQQSWPIDGEFRISRGARSTAEVIVVRLASGGCIGQGECVPYARYGESIESVMSQIESLRDQLAQGLDRVRLQGALPPGAARNAVDCALWDLDAKQSGVSARVTSGARLDVPVITAFTISYGTLDAMAERAANNAWRPLLKIKLASVEDLERLRAVRRRAPQSRIVVDANEAWSLTDFRALAPELSALRIEMVEQPVHADDDADLNAADYDFQVCADESCHDRRSLSGLAGRYDMINIKLDKTGGLTEALALKREALALDLGIMVGCMLGTSLAMAPAMMLVDGVDIVDLDGPLLLARDREHGIEFDGSVICPPVSSLWG